MVLLFLVALFLILLVLIQRGRGGGLAGAFGGMGGQSAFGTKAGDLFTRVTIITAAIWIVLCAASVKIFSSAGDLLGSDAGAATQEESGSGGPASTPPGKADGAAPADKTEAEKAPAQKAPAEKASDAKTPATQAPAEKAPAEDKPAGGDTPATEK